MSPDWEQEFSTIRKQVRILFPNICNNAVQALNDI